MHQLTTSPEGLLRRVSAERDAFCDLCHTMALALAVSRFGHIDACVGHRIEVGGYVFGIERDEDTGIVSAHLVVEEVRAA
jgi:hypothetical protein